MLTKRVAVKAGVLVVLLLVIPGAIAAQEDDSKAIKAGVFMKDRPTGKKPASTVRYKPKSKAPNVVSAPAGTSFAEMGITLWRFRRSTAADQTKELVEDEEGASTEWTLERVEDDTPLSPGQRVRIGIESLSRTGYLYVIDREMYEDGSTGEPKLIFPTKRTSDTHFVRAGRPIYIPSATGKFTMKPSEGAKRHVGELVTIIVSSERLVDPEKLTSRSISLTRQQVESWEKLWGAASTRYDLDGGIGQPMTAKEKSAGAAALPELTQDDPAPQTVYRVAIKPENPMILSVPLKFRK
ncbi:MAG: hypothetical protein AABM67_21180 [Acidobacteriota bacterium]